MYPPYDLQFANYVESRLNKIEHQLAILAERITQAEGSTVAAQTPTNSSSIPGISREKMTTINTILSNKVMGWKAALRKILVAVFGVNTLSQSCAKGKKNSRTRSLDSEIVGSITGKYSTSNHFIIHIFTDLLYQTYGESCVDLRLESINAVINIDGQLIDFAY